MTCGACERHVRHALERVPGVQQVVVDRKTATATVSRTDASPDIDELLDAVRAAGYDASVESIEGGVRPDDSGVSAGVTCACGASAE